MALCRNCENKVAVVYDTIGTTKLYYCGYCYVEIQLKKDSRKFTAQHRSNIQRVKQDKIVTL